MQVPRSLEVRARLDAGARDRIARAREAYLGGTWDGRDPTHDVRTDILQSWHRSRTFGIAVGGKAPIRPVLQSPTSGRLARAAHPVLARVSQDWADLGAFAFIVDRTGTQVLPVAGDRHLVRSSEERGSYPGACFNEEVAGTSGAALVTLRNEPVLVAGHEHYQDVATRVLMFGIPLRDAVGRTQGHFVMCASMQSAHPMMIPHAMEVAADVDARLAAATDHGDRAIFAEFLRLSAIPSVPVVMFNDRFCTLNAAAQQILGHADDIQRLKDAARDAGRRDSSAAAVITVGGETFRAQFHSAGGRLPRDGVVCTLHRITAASVAPGAQRPARGDDDTERTASTPLRRSRARSIPAVIAGERGSGRAHLAHETGPLREIRADDVGDADAWLSRVTRMLSSDDVLIRDIDRLDAGVLRAVLDLVRRTEHWCVATAGPRATGLDEVFPVSIECAPLRARRGEIPRLVRRMLDDVGAADVSLSPEARALLMKYEWPGNVAELRRTILTALVAQNGARISLEHLPGSLVPGEATTSVRAIDEAERRLIFEALKAAGWRRDAAAEALGISRSTMFRKLKQFGFQVPSSRS